ncbi:MAG: hypothetical protein LKJ80_00535 [Oscillibacter sp.]|jgi:hypothetical protein|nr:hypothetical protein [Oscillibacter sp.]
MAIMQSMQPQSIQPQQMRPAAPGQQPGTGGGNWSGEISYVQPEYSQMQGQMPGMLPNTMQGVIQSTPDSAVPQAHKLEFSTGLSQDALENPVSVQEAYQGSLKAMLAKNVGHYVVATFLIGTQSPVSWEGFLHSVGSDYLVIFQPDQGRYITGDFYALKFVEFHDTAGVVPPCAGYRRRDGQHIW